jgi:hypothetical protein
LFVAGIGTATLVGWSAPSGRTTASPTGTAGAGSRAGASLTSDAATAATGRAAHAAADPAALTEAARAVRSLLAARADAVLRGHRAGWAAGLDTGAASFRTAQLTEFDRIRQLPVLTWSYDLIGVDPITRSGGSGPETFTATVRLRYRLPGDTRDVEREQKLTLVRRAAHWSVAAVRTASSERDPWELGPLTVERGRRALVIGLGTTVARPSLQRTAREADVAAARVETVWGRASARTAVVIVPATVEQMAALIGHPGTAGLDQVAAMTTGELDRGRAASGGAADRVVLNPGSFPRLTAIGRQVVLTHELTHVVTRAAARLTPALWVEEGFANYVAYRGSHLSPTLIAADVLALVRAGTAPDRLPSADDFDAAHGSIAPAYADAWLAFALIAQGGADRPLRFYRIAAGLPAAGSPAAGPTGSPTAEAETAGAADTAGAEDQAVERACRAVLGISLEQFRQQWLAHRSRIAGQAR